MAIVKAKYIRGKGRIKAHLRYITHRRGVDGERITRPLFDRDGPLTKQHIYDTIDKAPRGAVFHKFVINFHPVKEDTYKDLNLWDITRKTLEHIKTRFGDSDPDWTVCERASISKNCSPFSNYTNANERRSGEVGCATSGCSRLVKVVAMDNLPASHSTH